MAAAAAAAGTEDEEGLPILSEKQSSTTTTTTKQEEESPAGAICAAILLILSFVGAVYLSIGAVHLLGGHWRSWFGPFDPVEYTVTIAVASGLDDLAKDLQHGPPPLLYPAFNLTLAVASPNTAAGRECMKPGTAVEVSYLRPSSGGVPLAAGTAPAFCVEAGDRREETSVVAWAGSDGVRLPGLVLDSLAAEMRRGAPEFGVKLTPLPYCGGGVGAGRVFCSDTVDVVSCWPAKVGGGPAPCSVSTKNESSSRRCRRAVASGRRTTRRRRRRPMFHSQRPS